MPDIMVTSPNVRDLVSEQEWEARVALAACYRLVAHYGWDDLVETHISMAVPGSDNKHFLINAYGMLFEQITASSLVKIDLQGNPILETTHGVNKAGFVIHSAIHAARPDAKCVMHTPHRSWHRGFHAAGRPAVQQPERMPVRRQHRLP